MTRLKTIMLLAITLLCASIMGCQSVPSITDTAIQAPLNSARPPDYPPWVNPPPGTDFTPMEPTRLFDNFYYVGTKSVGSFIIDTTDGLIMIDNGWSEKDCALIVDGMKMLGLNPANIKLILLSHEHIDHYGGTQYLKSKICPIVTPSRQSRAVIDLSGELDCLQYESLTVRRQPRMPAGQAHGSP